MSSRSRVTGEFKDDEWAKLQETFASGSPIIVLGPGCHRIAYDKSQAWSEVTRRMRLLAATLNVSAESSELMESAAGRVTPNAEQTRRHTDFLDGLWRSRLSDETRAKYGTKLPAELIILGDEFLPMPGDEEDVPPKTRVDRIRTNLAAPLLRALSECTRCLGSVVATGATPVASWHEVSHNVDAPEPVSIGVTDGDVDDADLDVTGEFARARAAKEMAKVAALADALWHWHRRYDLSQDHLDELEALGIGIDVEALEDGRDDDLTGPDDLTTHTLLTLEIGAIRVSTQQLVDQVFEGEHPKAISGAMIEWLSDLLWHVMSSDSAVPPSQAELTFYLNLRHARYELRRTFTRAHPGEFRGGKDDDVTQPVQRLLGTYDIGLGRGSWEWKHDERAKFARTIAATLLTMWEREDRQEIQVGTLGVPSGRMVIALASEYDLMLERQLMDAIERGAGFHVIVPMWATHGKAARHLVWLFGTYRKPEGSFQTSHLTSHGKNGALKWQWYDDPKASTPDIIGPILVKTNGSPFLDLDRQKKALPKALGLRQRGRADRIVELELATIFSEYDSLASIITFADGSSALPRAIGNALSWDDRSWLFFGDSFPDWIPRLRLLYSARSKLMDTREPDDERPPQVGDPVPDADDDEQEVALPSRERIAVDRDFDWPELALLEALAVDAYRGDLVHLAKYPHGYAGDGSVKEFLADVKAKQPW